VLSVKEVCIKILKDLLVQYFTGVKELVDSVGIAEAS